jgi:signal transduction histidine kinase
VTRSLKPDHDDRTAFSRSSVRFVDPLRDLAGMERITPEERATLRIVNQRIAAKPRLVDVVDFLFDETQSLIPCDRISLALIEEDGRRIVANHVRANYSPVLLGRGFAQDFNDTSLASVLSDGIPRIIGDLEQYLGEHPCSRSTELLLREGIRSSLTCPLIVEGRVVGFLFRSSRTPFQYSRKSVELQISIGERISQAVEKAWRIEQLEEANRGYFEMLGFVSHELKNPVASMVTDARLVADGYLGEVAPAQRNKLERLIKKGEQLLELVGEYLDLAQMESNELQANFAQRVSLESAVIEPVVEMVRPQIDLRAMRLTVDMSQTPRLLLDCDPVLLRIVLVNLMANAVKYGREGGEIRLKVSAGRSRVTVAVWNQGPGFQLTERSKLFRRFSRLDDPELRKSRGTGLGLYNAWRIVQLHGGTMQATSEQGSWAQFSFEIPQPPGPKCVA